MEEVGLVNFKLRLPETIKINLVFYALLLELVPYDIEIFILELNKEVNETVKYKVKEILERTK